MKTHLSVSLPVEHVSLRNTSALDKDHVLEQKFCTDPEMLKKLERKIVLAYVNARKDWHKLLSHWLVATTA